MAQHPETDRCDESWLAGLALRELVATLRKAQQAAQRHPLGSAIRSASLRELRRALRHALAQGRVRLTIGSGGPVLPGDPVPAGRRIEVELTRDDGPELRELVESERFAAAAPRRMLRADARIEG